jgi:imidazolonepropionase-like amidohydrolase
MLPSLITARASKIMREMVMRGFTTLRDAGGADLGYKQAVEAGYFVGPRLFVAGRAISQTGGHADPRVRSDQTNLCDCVHLGHGLGRVADGVTEVRRAVRDEIRLGADQVKIMASGGIASASDPIDQLQYSEEELEAIVDEAARLQSYVMAHAYPNEAIKRCVEAGVRTIEHGNLIDQETANLMAEKGAYLVPTMMAFEGIKRYGRERGYSPEQMEKNEVVLAGGTRSLEYAKRAGVKMAYGTDIALWHDVQSEEFLVRAEVLSPAELIKSATVIGAEVVRMKGKIGEILPGAFADILVVEGNPLEDLGLFQNQGAHLAAIIANGVFVKNELVGREEDWKKERVKKLQ